MKLSRGAHAGVGWIGAAAGKDELPRHEGMGGVAAAHQHPVFAATAVDATTTVVGGAADVAGAVITAPFGHSSDKPDHD